MEIRQLQLEMLEMLKLFRDICEKNNIKYSLDGGTLLGAVRHKGFIPWDDDLDVSMLRSEYNKFLEAWKKESPVGYFLQTKDIEEGFTRSFAKIRKENTTFLQRGDDPSEIHTGVFIDIFPVDRIPTNKVVRLFYYYDCMRYQLYNREFVPEKANLIVRMISKFLLISSSKEKRKKKRNHLYKRITRFNNDNKLPLAEIETVKTMQTLLNHDLFDNYVYLEFEDDRFMCVENWNHLLKKWYGDYMQLPPEDEREWKHKPVILDLKYGYPESINMLK